MNNKKKDILLSVAIGDISGVPYEFEGRTKNYNSIDLLRPDNTYSDDSVCTFACAEALLHHLDMASTLYKRGREDFYRGFGGNMARWLISPEVPPAYHSFGTAKRFCFGALNIVFYIVKSFKSGTLKNSVKRFRIDLRYLAACSACSGSGSPGKGVGVTVSASVEQKCFRTRPRRAMKGKNTESFLGSGIAFKL